MFYDHIDDLNILKVKFNICTLKEQKHEVKASSNRLFLWNFIRLKIHGIDYDYKEWSVTLCELFAYPWSLFVGLIGDLQFQIRRADFAQVHQSENRNQKSVFPFVVIDHEKRRQIPFLLQNDFSAFVGKTVKLEIQTQNRRESALGQNFETFVVQIAIVWV